MDNDRRRIEADEDPGVPQIERTKLERATEEFLRLLREERMLTTGGSS